MGKIGPSQKASTTIIALRKTNFQFQGNSSNTRVKKLDIFKLFFTGCSCGEPLTILLFSRH